MQRSAVRTAALWGALVLPAFGLGAVGLPGFATPPIGGLPGMTGGVQPQTGVMPTTEMPPQTQVQLPRLSRQMPASAPKSELRPLKGRWAVGVDSTPGLGAPTSQAVATLNSLSLRYWLNDHWGVDLRLGGAYSSQQSSNSTLSPLVTQAPGGWGAGGGLGLRYNLSEPSSNVLVQALARASGAQSAVPEDSQSPEVRTTTVAGFMGFGVEAFVPGWDWLSVEASAGVTGLSQSQNTQGGAPGDAAASGIGLAGCGYSPFNLAVHAYF
jgi:hypothetical protein